MRRYMAWLLRDKGLIPLSIAYRFPVLREWEYNIGNQLAERE